MVSQGWPVWEYRFPRPNKRRRTKVSKKHWKQTGIQIQGKQYQWMPRPKCRVCIRMPNINEVKRTVTLEHTSLAPADKDKRGARQTNIEINSQQVWYSNCELWETRWDEEEVPDQEVWQALSESSWFRCTEPTYLSFNVSQPQQQVGGIAVITVTLTVEMALEPRELGKCW
jgi:hypothetical protein